MSRVKYRQFYNGEFYFWGFIDGEFIAPKVIYPELVNDHFTGIRDKHDAEIYESDIVRSFYNGANLVRPFYPREVKWDEIKCGFNISSGLLTEVIGNIHQNPELLEEGWQ